MTGCSVIGCRNRSERGFLMKKFPADPKRRAIWIALVKGNRENWEPKRSSCVCEVHFEPGMWEKQRVDGKRALRWNAIPTLVKQGTFPVPKQPQQAQKGSLLKSTNRLILPKPELVIPEAVIPEINNPQDVWISPNPIQIQAVDLEESKMYMDPLHNYCRKEEDSKSTVIKPLLKSKQNKTAPATITNNDTDKFHNYFTKEGNPKNQTPVWVHSKNLIPIRPLPTFTIKQDPLSSELETSSENDYLNLPVECILQGDDTDENIENLNLELESNENDTPMDVQESTSNVNKIKEKYIFSRLSHVKCNDAACDKLHLQKERTINLLKKKIAALRRENAKLLKKLSEPNEALSKVFNQDQVHAITHKSTKWASKTIIKALELVIACSLKGYKEILRQNLPYPSIRTLQRKLDCDIS